MVLRAVLGWTGFLKRALWFVHHRLRGGAGRRRGARGIQLRV